MKAARKLDASIEADLRALGFLLGHASNAEFVEYVTG
jgi:hypothetical protein